MVGGLLPEQGSSVTSRRDQPCWKTLVNDGSDKYSRTRLDEANLVYRGAYIKALFGSATGSGPTLGIVSELEPSFGPYGVQSRGERGRGKESWGEKGLRVGSRYPQREGRGGRQRFPS